MGTRMLDGHQINDVNRALRVRAHGAGVGGAPVEYTIIPDQSHPFVGINAMSYLLRFQDGAPSEFGVNGITHEVLLEVLIDRLSAFQEGAFACIENARALQCLCEARHVLRSRTRARQDRGVEGTHEA